MERMPNSITPNSAEKVPFFKRILGAVIRSYNYVTGGVWSDTRNTFGVNLVKTINLSVRSFLNGELQLRAGSLTYQTLLAIVPALALVFAIGRGFGFQNLLQTQLFEHFPAQRQALSTAFTFVDSYLAQSSEGICRSRHSLFALDSNFAHYKCGGCVQSDLGHQAGTQPMAQDYRLHGNCSDSADSDDMCQRYNGFHVLDADIAPSGRLFQSVA